MEVEKIAEKVYRNIYKACGEKTNLKNVLGSYIEFWQQMNKELKWQQLENSNLDEPMTWRSEKESLENENTKLKAENEELNEWTKTVVDRFNNLNGQHTQLKEKLKEVEQENYQLRISKGA